MKWLIMFIFYFLYWGICYLCTGTDEKNLMGLRSYPMNVQKIVREKMDNVPKAKSIPNILISNILLFTIVFSIMGLLFKNTYNFNNYLSAFIYFLLLGEGLGLFDLLIIDLLWWRNTKRIRFSFLTDKQYYQDPKMHIDSFIRGIPLFIVVAALSASITSLI
jgi:hypothetical protein